MEYSNEYIKGYKDGRLLELTSIYCQLLQCKLKPNIEQIVTELLASLELRKNLLNKKASTN